MADTIKSIITDIETEQLRAEVKFPNWPTDPVHGAAILGEEAGEVLKAALDFYYGRGPFNDMEKEAIHTAAMAIRFLYSMRVYGEHEHKTIDSKIDP